MERSADGKYLRLRSGQIVTPAEYKHMARLRLLRLKWWQLSEPLRRFTLWLAERLPGEGVNRGFSIKDVPPKKPPMGGPNPPTPQTPPCDSPGNMSRDPTTSVTGEG